MRKVQVTLVMVVVVGRGIKVCLLLPRLHGPHLPHFLVLLMLLVPEHHQVMLVMGHLLLGGGLLRPDGQKGRV